MLAIVPEVGEPYRSVLSEMVDGMRRAASVRVVELHPTAPANLSIEDERAAVALGSAAAKVTAGLPPRLPIVAGAVVTPTGQPPLPGISLETDPDALFKQLVRLRPTMRTVHWVYRPERSGWLLERARTAASKSGLVLSATPVDDTRAATLRYQEILSHADSKTDAVWLTQDPALIGADSTLPAILGLAWTNNIVMFSGSLQHVSNGVLFALYPDNAEMGANLARLALAHAGGAAADFEPNTHLHRAINRRTAEHLGISAALSDYDLVLPAR